MQKQMTCCLQQQNISDMKWNVDFHSKRGTDTVNSKTQRGDRNNPHSIFLLLLGIVKHIQYKG